MKLILAAPPNPEPASMGLAELEDAAAVLPAPAVDFEAPERAVAAAAAAATAAAPAAACC